MALGVYVHLPFCPYICPYCDFAKWPMRRSRAERYLEALICEIESTESLPAATIFFGGGTPNAYEAQTIVALTERLRARFPAPGVPHEISIEVNPELVRADDFARYAQAGIDRISIGVQSFDPAEIRTLGRKHTHADVERAVRAARAAGIRSVSLDVIFAIPGQTARSWTASIQAALPRPPDPLTPNGLSGEEGTPEERWRAREPGAFADNDTEAELYGIAIERLTAAGYEHYEISNFARPGHRCRHNENYWANGEYLGLGVGAASYRGGERSVHTKDLETYVRSALAEGAVPGQSERLEGLAVVGEAIMLALRTAQGVDLAEFKERYGIDVLDRYAPAVAEYERDGFLERRGGRLALTGKGRFVANDVCGTFVTFQ